MRNKLVFFLIGIILFLTSLPLGTKMVMEINHNREMNATYEITKIGKGDPPNTSAYQFSGQTVELEEVIKNEEIYTDFWNYNIGVADLKLMINGEEIDTLQDYPIRVEENGLDRYYGEIAYLLLEDKKNETMQFIVLFKKTTELNEDRQNGDIGGRVPLKELSYRLYVIDEGGNVNNTSFDFTERNAVQTELLNASAVVPHRIGYYTHALEGYPSVFFPILFPFITFLAGFVMIIIFFPIRK